MNCNYYQQQKCTSCQWIIKPYSLQIEQKQQKVIDSLKKYRPTSFLEPVTSETKSFRNKAKMAVLGTVERPILGIMTNNEAVDLCDCPLYSNEMRDVLNRIKMIIKKLQLVPYNIRKKKGELKFILLTESDKKFILRFVLRTNKDHEKIKQALADIQLIIPEILVISINIQPEHSAIIEGKEETTITVQKQLKIVLNDIPLFIEKGSFFQTNTNVAAKLYATAQYWLSDLPISSIWDLFCGVGGFGLHCVNSNRQLTGIEINAEAIECAKLSAQSIGYEQIRFQSLDATQFALNKQSFKPDLILVNPPRRGLGKSLLQYLQAISANYILYSSCNLETLEQDLAHLTQYKIEKVQLFDMFPHTDHMEVLVLLIKLKE